MISIILPTCYRPFLLRNMLESLRATTRAYDVEIIALIDDDPISASQAVYNDIFNYIGLSSQSLRRRMLEKIVSPPITRFVTIITEFDQKVGEVGVVEAARWFSSQYARQVESHGKESIPPEGPLLIVSNHPGYYDGLAIAATLPRMDLKMVAGNYPIMKGLEYFDDHLILTASDLNSRMLAIRGAIRQLMQGGSLLIFPTGKVDPDPDVMPGAAESLKNWSSSIELILKKVPQAQVLVTIVSGVVAPASMHHPLTRLKKLPNERQPIAEFVQICQQALWPKTLPGAQGFLCQAFHG